MVVIGTAGFGNSLKLLLNRHLKQLSDFQGIFIQMELLKTTLKLPYGEMLRRCARGSSMGNYWKVSQGRWKKTMKLMWAISGRRDFLRGRGNFCFPRRSGKSL